MEANVLINRRSAIMSMIVLAVKMSRLTAVSFKPPIDRVQFFSLLVILNLVFNNEQKMIQCVFEWNRVGVAVKKKGRRMPWSWS